MRHAVAPIPCKPWMLNGLSERLVVSHYENDYGAAIRALNDIRATLRSRDVGAMSAHDIRALKREELVALGSVTLHEIYFSTLGGDGASRFTGSGQGTGVANAVHAALTEQFGSIAAWRQEFVSLAGALSHSAGWAMLIYSRRDGRLSNQITTDHSQAMIDAVPLIVLDMYEHAYHIDFGANAAAYIDAFMRNIDWTVVNRRLHEAAAGGASATETAQLDALPSVSVEELSMARERSDPIQVLDARPRHYFSRTTDMMQGAQWRDPETIDQWSAELSVDAPVFVYCAYGYAVGCGVTAMLRERGLDAKYVRGGLSAWYAMGGERTLKPNESRHG